MKLVVDMNLSPEWVGFLQQTGWEATHWVDVGNPKAKDAEIMRWALENRHVVFTHDLDFGSLCKLPRQVDRLKVEGSGLG